MYNDLALKVNRDLKKYEHIIGETDKNYDKLVRLGGEGYDPIFPYMIKYKILFEIKYLKNRDVDVFQIQNEFNIINNKLKTMEQKRGKDYREKLYYDLKCEVDSYHKTIDCMFDSDPVCLETENALDHRDAIEILMMELGGEYDFSAFMDMVSVLDEEFKTKYMRYIKAYLKKCPSIERPYYPDGFWWRHPYEFIKSEGCV